MAGYSGTPCAQRSASSPTTSLFLDGAPDDLDLGELAERHRRTPPAAAADISLTFHTSAGHPRAPPPAAVRPHRAGRHGLGLLAEKSAQKALA